MSRSAEKQAFYAGWVAALRHASERHFLGHNPEHLSDEQSAKAWREYSK